MAKKKVTNKKPIKKKTVVSAATTKKDKTTATGLEDQLWLAADKLRGHMDAAVYKHTVLGLVFLKYVSDSFMDRHNELLNDGDGFEEERDAYSEKNVFCPLAIWI